MSMKWLAISDGRSSNTDTLYVSTTVRVRARGGPPPATPDQYSPQRQMPAGPSTPPLPPPQRWPPAARRATRMWRSVVSPTPLRMSCCRSEWNSSWPGACSPSVTGSSSTCSCADTACSTWRDSSARRVLMRASSSLWRDAAHASMRDQNSVTSQWICATRSSWRSISSDTISSRLRLRAPPSPPAAPPRLLKAARKRSFMRAQRLLPALPSPTGLSPDVSSVWMMCVKRRPRSDSSMALISATTLSAMLDASPMTASNVDSASSSWLRSATARAASKSALCRRQPWHSAATLRISCSRRPMSSTLASILTAPPCA
mmetsp:Transcript_16689/g.49914  ORF Transcript_16689/g.49914 Transcript_16689/m.49914 type:complete len:316 (+) Transcript_16689:986-1933(+)